MSKMLDFIASLANPFASETSLEQFHCFSVNHPFSPLWSFSETAGDGGGELFSVAGAPTRFADYSVLFTSKLCVGVVELIMTSPKISYAPEVEKVCKARDHSDAYAEHHLQKGQGVAGRAFLSGNLCFCIDVTRFFKTDYPRKFKLTSCFVVGLKSTYTQDDDYALEFFLPPAITDKSEQDCLLRSLFQTMKQLYSSLNVVFWD
ncbi:hypothetical protein ISN44_As11g008930 [Arabidopsis suecica]|uniref:NLP1-9 GAF domain-containing protein n=1 Tax=Arabidopsis suecica TaxID=45249 RepID=A0A8T1Z6F2_ARASU|nr:hypothetical protein ISN44_As11g008930 [Arabidopsis suecica]